MNFEKRKFPVLFISAEVKSSSLFLFFFSFPLWLSHQTEIGTSKNILTEMKFSLPSMANEHFWSFYGGTQTIPLRMCSMCIVHNKRRSRFFFLSAVPVENFSLLAGYGSSNKLRTKKNGIFQRFIQQIHFFLCTRKSNEVKLRKKWAGRCHAVSAHIKSVRKFIRMGERGVGKKEVVKTLHEIAGHDICILFEKKKRISFYQLKLVFR